MTTDFQLKPGHSCCYKILDLKPIFCWLSWYYSSRVRKVLPLIDTEWSGWFLLLLGGSWGSPCGLYWHNGRDDFILSLHSVSEFTCLECWDISLESFKYRSLGSSRFPGLCCHESGYSSVQSLSCVRLFVTPWTAARQASLSITNSQSLPKLISIELVMPSNHLILCCPLLLLLSILPSIRVFSSESVLHMKWPKYWSFSLNISSSNEHSGLLSLRIDWLDLIAVQGTLKSILQHHSLKASILRRSAFFIVQLSHPYMTTGKTIALTRWTFVGKVMSLLFNMLSRLVITFLPRSKRLLISWLQSPSSVILEPPKMPWS